MRPLPGPPTPVGFTSIPQSMPNQLSKVLYPQADAGPPVFEWRSALEAVPADIFVFDATRRLILAHVCSPSLQRMGEIKVDMTCCEMFWKAQGESQCVVDRALKSGTKAEFELTVGGGEQLPFVVIVQPLFDNGDATASGVLVTARDISDLRHAEAEVIVHKSFMSSIADRSPDEIYALNKGGRITWVNQRAERDNPLAAQGQRIIDFIAPESQAALLDGMKRAFAGQEIKIEIRATRTDENHRDVEAHTSPLWKEGEVEGVLLFLRDITERKRAEALASQSDKLRAVGELAAGVAHNLNNSLTVIKGRSQLMEMRTTDESTLKSLRVINDAVEDGSKTLRRILEFARRDSIHRFDPVELDDLVMSSIEIAWPKWQRKSPDEQIQVKPECTGPIYVKGDLTELREVVLNLVFNAVDAMPKGGVLEVGTRVDGDHGCFWVADTGCGMSAETIERIFEPFFTTKGDKGTGLGLSASHGIISRHGGEIVTFSRPGEGTRFEVRLPINT